MLLILCDPDVVKNLGTRFAYLLTCSDMGKLFTLDGVPSRSARVIADIPIGEEGTDAEQMDQADLQG